MTKEEALQRIVDNNFAGEYGFDMQIFIDCMVVAREKILNSQFPSKDCFSRAEALKNLALTNGKDDVYRMIRKLPSVQPTAKENLVVGDCISRDSLKHKLQEHHDFFVNAYGGFSNLPQNDKSRVDEITNCIAMVVNEPSVQPNPKTGYISIDDVMSVFNDFMCGEVDEEGIETFLEMLKDKAESEGT